MWNDAILINIAEVSICVAYYVHSIELYFFKSDYFAWENVFIQLGPQKHIEIQLNEK